MNDTLPDLPDDPRGEGTQSPERRRLLRAAASVAPLVATLPSGAALASASISGCISQSVDQSHLTPPQMPDALDLAISPSGDGWLRAAAILRRMRRGGFRKDGYTFSGDPLTGPFYDGLNGIQLDATWTVDTTVAAKNVAVLVMRTPLPDGTNPTTIDLTAPGCTRAPNTVYPASFNGCVYPVGRLDRSVSAINGNTALTNSCWASFNV
jgi:hypothetical protein